jgi:hypothetical protein
MASLKKELVPMDCTDRSLGRVPSKKDMADLALVSSCLKVVLSSTTKRTGYDGPASVKDDWNPIVPSLSPATR